MTKLESCEQKNGDNFTLQLALSCSHQCPAGASQVLDLHLEQRQVNSEIENAAVD